MIKLRQITKKLTSYEWVAIALLACCSLFAAYFSAKWLIINADATSSIYLMKGHVAWGDILIADWHTNLLKLPITFIQAHLPFTMVTFAIANALLLFSMLLGWAVATSMALGRKYFLPTILLLSFVIAGSPALSMDAAFTTIRNIEYPIYFLLVILFWRIISALPDTILRAKVSTFIIAMAILQSSDPFFVYATLPPIVVLLGILKKNQKLTNKALAIALAILVAPFILAKLVIFGLYHFGAFQYHGETLSPNFYTFMDVPSQFWSGIYSLIGLFNADFFGKKLGIILTDRFIMASICFVAIYSFVIAVKRTKGPALTKNLPRTTILFATIFLFALYMSFSAFEHQSRFLVLMLLVMCTTTVEWLTARFTAHDLKPISYRLKFYISCGIILTMVGIAYNAYRLNNFYGLAQQQANLKAIDNYIAVNNVNTVITGHSYGSTLSFWTNGNLQYIPVLYCNQNLPFLTRQSWYNITPDTSRNVALIVDKEGRDANSWYCSKQRIQQYYGKPYTSKTFVGIDNKPVDVYIYPNTIINKVHFISHKGTPEPMLAN